MTAVGKGSGKAEKVSVRQCHGKGYHGKDRMMGEEANKLIHEGWEWKAVP